MTAANKSSLCFKLRFLSLSLPHPSSFIMPTELPYAADAQMSLSYDELEVIPSACSRIFPPYLFTFRCCAYNTRRKMHRHMLLSRPSSTMPGALWRVLNLTNRPRASSYCKAGVLSLLNCLYPVLWHHSSLKRSSERNLHVGENVSITSPSDITSWANMKKPTVSMVGVPWFPVYSQ